MSPKSPSRPEQCGTVLNVIRDQNLSAAANRAYDRVRTLPERCPILFATVDLLILALSSCVCLRTSAFAFMDCFLTFAVLSKRVQALDKPTIWVTAIIQIQIRFVILTWLQFYF